MEVAADCGNFAAAEKSVVEQNLLAFDDMMTQLGGNTGRHYFVDRISEVVDGLHMERCCLGSHNNYSYNRCMQCLLADCADHLTLQHSGCELLPGFALLTGFVAANCDKSCLQS